MIRDGLAAVALLNGDIIGLDLKTGEKRWNVNAWKDFDREPAAATGKPKGAMGWGFPSSFPAFEDKIILNTCSRKNTQPPVVAIDFASGKLIWGADPGVDKKYSAGDHSAAVFQHQGRWLNVNPTWRYILCLDPRDGKKLWEIPDPDLKSGSEKVLTPVYNEGYLLFDRAGMITCIKLDPDGNGYRHLWTRRGTGQDFSHAVILGGRVYVAGQVSGYVWAGDQGLEQAGNGKQGAFNRYEPARTEAKPPTLGEGLICIEAETGRVLDVRRVASKLGHIVTADGLLYATGYVPREHAPKPEHLGVPLLLIKPVAEGMEVVSRFRLPLAESEQIKDMEWQANAPPVVAHGRLLVHFGPLWCFDLRPDRNPPPAEPAAMPTTGIWDLRLQDCLGKANDLFVSVAVKEGKVVSAVAAAPQWNRSGQQVVVTDAALTKDGLEGSLTVHLRLPTPSPLGTSTASPTDQPAGALPITLKVSYLRGRLVGTYSGGRTATTALNGQVNDPE